MSPRERAAVDQAHRQFGEPTATPKPRAGEHTKGPWRAGKPQGGSGLVWADGVAVADCLNGDGSDDARRIVACVNACEGIEGNPPNVAELIETLHRAMVERDALRERLRSITSGLRDHLKHKKLECPSCADEVEQAEILLAKHGR